MSESKHTPGPWGIKPFINSPSADIDARSGESIATVWDVSDVNVEANARLIAAAPDMLDVLKSLTATARTFRNVPKDKQEWTPIDDENLDAAFALLAKIEGE